MTNGDPIALGLPHRAPFIFVDVVLELQPGDSATCRKCFAPGEPFFRGHFPGDPIVPGVILVEALAQTLGNADKNGDPMQLGMKMRGKIQEGRKLAEKAIADAEKMLTPEQWAKVPKNIKEPFQGRGSGGEGGGFRPPDR